MKSTIHSMPGQPIDTDFPAAFANSIARLESFNKHLYRPNTYLHKWWARRCGTTLRLILKGLVDDPGRRGFYAAGGLEGKIILDPMMGGGSVLHEAIRMGANVIGADIDPIPVLQARATLSHVDLEKLEAGFRALYTSLVAQLGHLFEAECPVCSQPTPLRFTLHGARAYCGCGPAIWIDSYILREQSDGTAVRICPRCRAVTGSGARCRCPDRTGLPPVIEKSVRVCTDCGERYRQETTTPFYTRYEPLAVVGECAAHGLFFGEPGDEDLARQWSADRLRPSYPRRDTVVEAGLKSADLVRRGVTSYSDLFSSRQLLYLTHGMRQLPDADPIVRLNLALLLSTSLEFNSMLCGYKGASRKRPGAIRHTFSHHAYSFPYTALENNPLNPSRASGTLQRLFHDRVRRARRWAKRPIERVVSGDRIQTVVIAGEIDSGREMDRPEQLGEGIRRFHLIHGSSAKLRLEGDSVDAVVTDPPYYDSVQYSDLAAFFRPWLRQMIPAQADWDVRLEESAVDQSDDDGERYTRLLGAIFSECHRVLKKQKGRLIFTFHHWNPSAWTALTLALRQGRFTLVNRYVVHAENPSSVHIANVKSLTHDAILVLAPLDVQSAGQWSRPVAVHREDSARFCQDCSSVLGWMLDSDLAESEIAETWLQLLSGSAEVKTV